MLILPSEQDMSIFPNNNVVTKGSNQNTTLINLYPAVLDRRFFNMNIKITENATSYYYDNAFSECKKFNAYLYIYSDISKSISFNGMNMFNNCYNWYGGTTQYLSDIHFPNGTQIVMNNMFNNCTNLRYLSLQWQHSSAGTVYANHAFYNCRRLQNIHSEDFSIVGADTTMYAVNMFYYCTYLLNSSILKKVTNLADGSYMFYHCQNLRNSYVSNIHRYMYFECNNLTTLYTKSSSIATSVDLNSNSKYAFYDCNNLSGIENVTLKYFSYSNGIDCDMSYCFYNTYLSEILYLNFNTGKSDVIYTGGNQNGQFMFQLSSINNIYELTSISASSKIDYSYMFSECYKLKNVRNMKFDLGNYSTTTKLLLIGMFKNCNWLENVNNIHINSLDCYMTNMFYNCEFLQKINNLHWEIKQMSGAFGTGGANAWGYIDNCFAECKWLQYVDGIIYRSSGPTYEGIIINSAYAFKNCYNLNYTEGVLAGRNAYGMFFECNKLNSDIYLPNETNILNYAFYNCYNFAKSIYIKHPYTISCNHILMGTDRYKKKNIHCGRQAGSSLSSSNICGTGVLSWLYIGPSGANAQTANGIYNTYYNINIYWNYLD